MNINMKILSAKPWTTVFAQIDMKDVTIKFLDGTPTPNEITITIGEGNLTYTETRNIEYILDRGVLDEVRLGDETPVELSTDFKWSFITGTTGTGGVPSPEDFLKRIGAASAYISTDSDLCRPFAIDI